MATDGKGYDVVVIGSGLGGLLIAALLCKIRRKVLVLERRQFVGGRFTSFQRDGFVIGTGAAHMVPHGSRGTVARIIREELGLDCKIHDANVFVSLHANNGFREIRSIIDLGRLYPLLSIRETLDLLKIFFLMKLNKHIDNGVSFLEWLQRYTKSPRVLRLFESAMNVGVGVGTDDIPYNEARNIVKNARQFGVSGVIQGGCKGVTSVLETFIISHGGAIGLGMIAEQILIKKGEAWGLVCHSRDKKERLRICCDTLISDIGPKDTYALISNRTFPSVAKGLSEIKEAEGVEIHFSSKKSLINHTGGILCLDTERVAGIAQPSNADPSLAPPGKHLLIAFQTLKSGNIKREIELGVSDLRRVFGKDFDEHCEILTTGVFRGKWPVNRVVQGKDFSRQTPIGGLYLVGDACKPSGHAMAEGVAKGVENVFAQIVQN